MVDISSCGCFQSEWRGSKVNRVIYWGVVKGPTVVYVALGIVSIDGEPMLR